MPATAPICLWWGSRGHGGFTEALLGSVSQHCVHHASCPVVVIRGQDHDHA
jgi:nucleotide-binding universal stress UspA family protein